MKISEAALALDGKIEGEDAEFFSVSTDTRKIVSGDLFVALKGERFDGADFAVQALKSGAAAVMANEKSWTDSMSPALLVQDTRLALGNLAACWRNRFEIPLVAITGSNGKTTVKEMTAAILCEAAGSDEAVLATKGNLNNDIGMPLTLLKLNKQHRYAVIEMGMNHFGEISYLTRIARPKVALINNASGAHLEGLGSVEGVARAKGEIFEGLEDSGMAIINADDEHAPLWRMLAGSHARLEFGLNEESDIKGIWQPHESGLRLEVRTPKGEFAVLMQVPGEHNARNALASVSIAIALDVPLKSIALGLERFSGVAGRMQRKKGRNGASLIDDTYNANPASMRAAIKVLAKSGVGRVMVLGDMGELGSDAESMHAEIGRFAKESGIEKLYALGEMSRIAAREFGENAKHFERMEDLQSELEGELHEGTTLLFKGSRFMKMERAVEFCLGGKEEKCS